MAYIPTKVRRAARTIGEQLRIQRKLMGLTAQMVAQRADITTVTLRRTVLTGASRRAFPCAAGARHAGCGRHRHRPVPHGCRPPACQRKTP